MSEHGWGDMSGFDTLQRADTLLRDGRSDEEIERLTGLGLDEILSLRAMLATDVPVACRVGR